MYFLLIIKLTSDSEEELQEKIKVMNEIFKLEYNGFNVFPKDFVYTKEKACGYLNKYLENAVNFLECLNISLPYLLRFNAAIDTSKQLKFLHQNGIIANDIKLANHIISIPNSHGSLLDFENMILINDYKVKCSTYRFYKNFDILKPSFYEDVKKQFICDLSLLFQYDFENLMIDTDELC